MPDLLLVIVLGPPGVGKTTLARRLAADLGLPLLVRDDIKEILFDVLGWSDREWSQKLGQASWQILYYLLERLLQMGQSVIVESNFKPELASADFRSLQERYSPRTVQVLCEARQEVAWERFRQRAESGARHPGHIDHVNVVALEQVLRQGTWAPLEITGAVLRVDLTDFETVDYAGIAAAVRAML